MLRLQRSLEHEVSSGEFFAGMYACSPGDVSLAQYNMGVRCGRYVPKLPRVQDHDTLASSSLPTTIASSGMFTRSSLT
ncbi:hypothetical protein NL676_035299 [Syzygium grande]|nr:hypothetical protein NL676_035299 [Syzygium grande]